MLINLRDVYLYYTTDVYVDVPKEVVDLIKEMDRAEHAYRERTRYHRAYYSLDTGDGIENEAVDESLAPPELVERMIDNEELYRVMCQLSSAQARRIYAHYILGMSKAAIARAEGVSPESVVESIQRGLNRLYHLLNE